MAITYDKKALMRTKKIISKGKHAYALKSAIVYSVIWFGFMILLQIALRKSQLGNFNFDMYFYSIWGVGALVILVFQYFSNLKNYKLLKDVYDESVNYFKENDPTYLDDLG